MINTHLEESLERCVHVLGDSERWIRVTTVEWMNLGEKIITSGVRGSMVWTVGVDVMSETNLL